MKEGGDNHRAPRPVTIVHVAQAAGVSVKSVSRVMNNEPNVRPELRTRVMAEVERLGYTASVAARRMGGSKSYLLVAFNDKQLTLNNWRSERGNNWIDQMQFSAMLTCAEHGYHLLLELIDPQSEDFKRRVATLLASLRPDGVILTPPSCEDPIILSLVESRQIPFVRLGSREAGPGYRVFMDDHAAAHFLTRQLLALGHRRIGLITGSPRFQASRYRREGFEAALVEAGVAAPETYIEPGDFSFESGVVAAERLLDRAVAPTAIIASNDEMALAVLHVARARGVDVPGRLSLATFDDTPSVKFSLPPLTTIRQPTAEMSARAAEILIAAAANGAVPQTADEAVPFRYIPRESTAPPHDAGA